MPRQKTAKLTRANFQKSKPPKTPPVKTTVNNAVKLIFLKNGNQALSIAELKAKLETLDGVVISMKGVNTVYREIDRQINKALDKNLPPPYVKIQDGRGVRYCLNINATNFSSPSATPASIIPSQVTLSKPALLFASSPPQPIRDFPYDLRHTSGENSPPTNSPLPLCDPIQKPSRKKGYDAFLQSQSNYLSNETVQQMAIQIALQSSGVHLVGKDMEDALQFTYFVLCLSKAAKLA